MFAGKKGSLQDVIFVMVVLLFFGMVVLLGYKIMGEVDDKFQAMGDDQVTADAKAASTSLRGQYTGAIDNSFLLLTIGLAMVALVFAALVRVHPIFIPFFFIALILVTFLGGIFSNIYQEMAGNSELATQADELTITSGILNILPLFVFIVGVLMMVVQYKMRDTIT